MNKIRTKAISRYSMQDFNDAITYTKLLAVDAPDYSTRANAKLASAYVDMMDLIEPGWRQVAFMQLKANAQKKGVKSIEVGNVGFEAIGNIRLSTDTVLVMDDLKLDLQ